MEIMKPIGHSSSKESFHSLVVVEFASSALQDTIDWIVNKIKAPKISGGGGLLVKSIEIEGVSGIQNLEAKCCTHDLTALAALIRSCVINLYCVTV